MAVIISKVRANNPNLKGGKGKIDSRIANKNHFLYIATRDGVLIENSPDIYDIVEHGAFGNIETKDIKKIANDIYRLTDKGKVFFKGIISLKEDDAIMLGYTSRKKWELLLNTVMPDIANILNISMIKSKFVAAIHLDKGHPHLHYILWDSDIKKIENSFITPQQQDKIRELVSKEINRELTLELTLEKNIARDQFLQHSKDFFKNEQEELKIRLPPNKFNKDFVNEITRDLLHLINDLPTHGRILYKLMSPDIKNKVDKIVDKILCNNKDFNTLYRNYVNHAVKLAQVYTDNKVNLNKVKINAENDLRKRLANQILLCAKELRLYNLDKYNLNKTSNQDLNLNNKALNVLTKQFLRNIFQTTQYTTPAPDIYMDLKKYRTNGKQQSLELKKEREG